MPMLSLVLLVGSLTAVEPPTAEIGAALAHFLECCRADAGELWGVSLCGPVLIADFEGGRLYASAPDGGGELAASGGLYAGPLPPSLPRANTSLDWQGRRWTQVLWPLPSDRFERLRLLLHESFHRIQPALGLSGAEHPNAHLDEPDGRSWMRLELRALRAALKAADWRAVLEDALALRRHRHQLIESARSGEWALEANEGLAEYTGVRLTYAGADAAERAAATLADADGWDHLARRFAYASGPAWGLLLDRIAPDWRRQVLDGADWVEIAGAALPAELEDDGAAIRRRAARYGLAEIEVEEAERARQREAERDRLRALLLAPVALQLPLAEARMSFDPRAVTALPPAGTVYHGLTLHDRWGRIEVRGAALIAPDFSALRVSPVIEVGVGRLAGADWDLTLDAGWVYANSRVAPRADPR